MSTRASKSSLTKAGRLAAGLLLIAVAGMGYLSSVARSIVTATAAS